MSEFNLTAKLILSVLLVVSILSGCSGMAKVEMMAPVAPVLEVEVGRPYPYEIGHTRYSKNVITFTRRDLHVEIFPVKLSEQMTAIFGPAVIIPTPAAERTVSGQVLRILVSIDLEFGTASFEPEEFAVLAGESRRLLKPISHVVSNQRAGGVVQHGDWLPRTEILYSRPGQENIYLYHLFTYDISRHDLPSFTFRLGDINVNGTVVSFPEISFERRSDYENR